MNSVKGMFGRSGKGQDATYPEGPSAQGGVVDKHDDLEKEGNSDERVRLFRPYTFAVVMIVSIGGMIFGFGIAS